MRTCREMGIATVAVYSTVDRNMLHVRYADEAYLIGEGPPLESYLNYHKIIDFAKKAGVDAVHPGYGFLSERTEFAEACSAAGITFVGPKPAAVKLLGDKVSARRTMMAAGVAAAKASGYENAGTVEFLFDPKTQEFYFLEVNTRLQVEHPVTEWLTGRDLVRDQIRVAAGEPLGFSQADVQLRGAAIECRIAAEDPYNNYLPSLGRIDYVSEPSGPGVRVDSSIFSGIEIPYF